jgi:hypothetical protein
MSEKSSTTVTPEAGATRLLLRRVNYLDSQGKFNHYWQTVEATVVLLEPMTRDQDVIGNWVIVPEAKESEYRL